MVDWQEHGWTLNRRQFVVQFEYGFIWRYGSGFYIKIIGQLNQGCEKKKLIPSTESQIYANNCVPDDINSHCSMICRSFGCFLRSCSITLQTSVRGELLTVFALEPLEPLEPLDFSSIKALAKANIFGSTWCGWSTAHFPIYGEKCLERSHGLKEDQMGAS